MSPPALFDDYSENTLVEQPAIALFATLRWQTANLYHKVLLKEKFPDTRYLDVAGLCKFAILKDIEAQGWDLNPRRYVGVADREAEDVGFAERLEEMNEELEMLNTEEREFEEMIWGNVTELLGV